MRVLAFDVESDGLHHEDGVVTISFTSSNKSVAFAVNHPEQDNTEREAIEKIQRIVDNTDILVGHNTKFDYKHLLNLGIKFKESHVFIDTMILWWFYTGHRETNISLDDLSLKLLNKQKVKGYDFKKKKASEYPLKGLLYYNQVDTELTFECYVKLIKRVDQGLVSFYSDLIRMYGYVEMNGLGTDEDMLVCMYDVLKPLADKYYDEAYQLLERPINMKSGPQLSAALFGGTFYEDGYETVTKHYKAGPKEITRRCKVPVTLEGMGFSTKGLKQNKNGTWPTGKKVLENLKGRTKKAKEYIRLLKEFKKYNGILTKFVIPFINATRFGIMYPDIRLPATGTGRPSCQNPNLFNMKRAGDIWMLNPKLAVVSRFEGGYIGDIDFSSAEWRLAAWRSKDKKMLQEIRDGIDAHKNAAVRFLKMNYDDVDDDTRQSMKGGNFGIIYGITGPGLAFRDDIPLIKTSKQGWDFIEGFYDEYYGLKATHDRDITIAETTGKLIMETGRVYNFSGDYFDEKQVKNYPVQGLSSDMVMCCLLEVWKRLRDRNDVYIVNSVYDSVIIDCETLDILKEVSTIIQDIFNNAHLYVRKYFPTIDLSTVPIESEVEYGKRWGDTKKI